MDLNALESKLAAFGLEEDPPLAPAAPSANTLGHAPAPAAAPTDSAKKRKKKTTIKKRLRRSTGGAVSSPSANSSPGNRFTRLYEAGKKQLEKQKRIRESVPNGCTFTPKTNARRKSSSGSSNKPSPSSRFDKLYLEAKKSKANMERKRTMQQLKPEGCTFAPKTNLNRTKSSSPNRGASSRFDSLYADAAKTKAKIARERERRLMSSATFKPKITRKAQRAASPSPGARFEQLYQDGRRDLQVQRAKQRADREMQECTFSPRINKRSSTRSSSARRSRTGNGDKESFQDRLLAYGRKAEERLIRKRMESQTNGDMAHCTFSPKINNKSNSYVRRRPKESAEEISSRLSQVESKEQFERRIERRRRQLEQQKGATFKPRTSRRSSSARRSREDGDSNSSSIWERLNSNRETVLAKNRRLREEKQRRELAKCTFQPNVASSQKKKINGKDGRSKDGVDQKERTGDAANSVPVWDRLSAVNMSAVMSQRDELKKRQELKECTFKPKLEPKLSKAAMMKSPDKKPIWERLYESRKDMNKIEKLAAKQELAPCTFAPHISEDSEMIASEALKNAKEPIWNRLYADAIEDQKKETENERLRKELEMHGCTFEPNIHIGEDPEISENPNKVVSPSKDESNGDKKKNKRKTKRIVRRKTKGNADSIQSPASKAIQEFKMKKKKMMMNGEASNVSTKIFVPKNHNHNRDSSVEVGAPNESPPPNGPPSRNEEVEQQQEKQQESSSSGGHTKSISSETSPTSSDKSAGRELAESLFNLLDANHNGRIEKSEFRKQLRAQEEKSAVQALYMSAGIVDLHASGKQIKKLFDSIDDQHMTIGRDGKRYIDLDELTVFCEKKGAKAV